mmetsp:Transcript_12209/g.19727  ORF Transcript_12209/g.19727 Transcript_12209/m.19727 type:complete len:608 (-) Transcript_12209:861-2684(-)
MEVRRRVPPAEGDQAVYQGEDAVQDLDEERLFEEEKKLFSYLPQWSCPPSLPVFSLKDFSLVITIALTVFAFGSRYYKISQPDEVVFDEVHFGGFANYYLRGEYYFDIHPPLGKLLIALATKFVAPNYDGKFDFGQIHNKYNESVPYVAMRFLPATASAFLVVLMYIIARQMNMSNIVAASAALAILFESSMLAQSRLILLDSFILFFGACSVLSSLRLARYGADPKCRNGETFWTIMTGVFTGCAASIKWTALAVVAGVIFHQGLLFLVGLASVPFGFVRRRKTKDGKIVKQFQLWRILDHPSLRVFARTILLVIVAGAVYMFFQYLHFKILYRMGNSFFMDFHTEEFRATIQGDVKTPREGVVPLGFWAKFIELTRTMFSANKGILQTHPYQSKFWGWPIGQGSMWYWGKGMGDGKQAAVMVAANPPIYYVTTAVVFLVYPVAALFALGYIVRLPIWALAKPEAQREQAIQNAKRITDRLKSFVMLGTVFYVIYVGNMLPYVGVARSTYAYHYFPALFAAIILTAITAEFCLFKWPYAKYLCYILCVVFIAYAGLFFYRLMPVIYGDPMVEERRQYIMNKLYWVGGPEQKLPWPPGPAPPPKKKK